MKVNRIASWSNKYYEIDLHFLIGLEENITSIIDFEFFFNQKNFFRGGGGGVGFLSKNR